MATLTWLVTGAGSGTLTNFNSIVVYPPSSPNTANVVGGTSDLTAAANSGSVFGGWSCVGATAATTFNQPAALLSFPISADVTCTATFNLSTPVNASVESSLALALTFVGITAMAGFKKWRHKT